MPKRLSTTSGTRKTRQLPPTFGPRVFALAWHLIPDLVAKATGTPYIVLRDGEPPSVVLHLSDLTHSIAEAFGDGPPSTTHPTLGLVRGGATTAAGNGAARLAPTQPSALRLVPEGIQ